ncbi:uncharacterized protein LOC105683168 isoform X1 [Athalia rosae]|uniref:uncharacterized protein LOC105683168 isoform X1 n=1 Tax=Athalia rosae TaxID=37344 RepID=UPI002033FF5B|nr:uncharacterized protein LOC105683168 isoform X1 [Athalia rosae]
MPSKKKKYNARFPAGRIKKIMQTDEEVGKVAQAVPVIISRTLELFVESLLTKTMQITSAKNAKTLSPSHMKQCILSESRFDFLKDLVKGLPDVTCPDDDVPTPPLTPAPQPAHGQTFPVVHPPAMRSDTTSSHRMPTDLSSTANIGVSRQNSGEKRGIGFSAMTISSETTQVNAPVSHYQTAFPTPFNVSQPNFYTEVNPINLSTSSTNVNATIKPSSNYSNTPNIDEDYDT